MAGMCAVLSEHVGSPASHSCMKLYLNTIKSIQHRDISIDNFDIHGPFEHVLHLGSEDVRDPMDHLGLCRHRWLHQDSGVATVDFG